MKVIARFFRQFVFCFFIQIVFASCYVSGSASKLTLCEEPLLSLTKPSIDSCIKNPSKENMLAFSFSQNQRESFLSFQKENGESALSLTVQLLPLKKNSSSTDDNSLFISFLPDESFVHDEKKRRALANVHADLMPLLEQEEQRAFTILLSLPKEQKLPFGFFVQTNVPVLIKDVQLQKAAVGFSKSEIPLFAFGHEGGTVDFSFSSADFSCADSLFGTNASVIEISFFPTQDIGSAEKQNRLRFSMGKENISVRRTRGEQRVRLYRSAFSEPFSSVSLGELSEEVSSFMLKKSDIDFSPKADEISPVPIPADPGLILSWNKNSWRQSDYEIFSWEQFPSVLFFDFADYSTQNKFFTRLAYFVEKAGYKGTLVDDYIVENKHGYNAHDYKANDLARFFSQVQRENFPINEKEKNLRDILLANKIIVPNEAGLYSPGEGAVISVSRESPDYLRYTLVAHESWHGVYFADEDFRNTVYVSYSMFDPESMEFLKTYWETQPTLSYDRADEYLMKNEFMAYLMQQPVSQIKNYWLTHAKWNSVQKAEKELADYVILTDAQAFEDAANFLSSYSFDRWGLSAGRVNLVAR